MRYRYKGEKMSLTICFLHGLLGDKYDWDKVISRLQTQLPEIRCIALDLPYHGKARKINVNSFAQARQYLQAKIKQEVGNAPYWLVGYSLGGRLIIDLLAHCCDVKKNLQGVVLEGVNLGLATEQARQIRWENDQHWANAFYSEPLKSVLERWYQQAVFSHLTEIERKIIIEKRQSNDGKGIAKMLLATSLAKQPDYSTSAWQEKWRFTPRFLPIVFLCGEKDRKFQQIAGCIDLPTLIIKQAGHNTHQENPQDFVAGLLSFFSEKHQTS